MKILTIGRGDDCDIILSDVENRISRRHALLRIYPTGKMELIPLGRNGTYRNGNALKDNAPHVVKRSDVISFAHVKQLDWDLVHNPYKPYYIGIFSGLAVVVILLGILLLKPYLPDISFGDSNSNQSSGLSSGMSSGQDSTNQQRKDSLKLEEDATTAKPNRKRYPSEEKAVASGKGKSNKGKPQESEAIEHPQESSDESINMIN